MHVSITRHERLEFHHKTPAVSDLPVDVYDDVNEGMCEGYTLLLILTDLEQFLSTPKKTSFSF